MFFSPKRSKAEGRDDRPKVNKLSLTKKGIGSDVRAERMDNADTDLQLLNEHERERQLQKQKKRRRQGKEEYVCHANCGYSLYFLLYIHIYLTCIAFSTETLDVAKKTGWVTGFFVWIKTCWADQKHYLSKVLVYFSINS